ncbi:MAG: hypothetical protein IJL69_06280 [Oscillospiraceae bacterium]|jgi:hypothetical protein|nr:hypothetical protein [Oscillospiraceae bacterium]
MECETCTFWVYDENDEEFVCMACPDEDDVARMAAEEVFAPSRRRGCPYYRLNDEYRTAGMQ